VTLLRADVFDLPFPAGYFDHAFICFVLEHLPDPEGALQALKRALRPGGSMTVIEGDHGSAFFHPDSPSARRAIQCMVELQQRAGGDPLIGRRLYPLLVEAGLSRGPGGSSGRLRGRQPAGTGRGLHEEDLHGHGRGGW
jgi:SAM-dependent methyltransferase